MLLTTNRLAYEDYRAWREGRLETLDAVLADGQRESCAWLEAAANDPSTTFGPADFEEAAVTVGETSGAAVLTMSY